MDVHRPRADRLLLVEDCVGDADLIRRCLDAAAGGAAHEVVTVPTLAKALAWLDRGSFDLALLDLGLPDSVGVETLKRLVASAPDLPVIVLTGHEEDGLGIACIDAGAQDYLGKSGITPDSLSRVIGFCLGRFREAQAKQLRMATQKDRLLSSAVLETPITLTLSGAGPIREREPEAFDGLRRTYQTLLEQYMGHISQKRPKPKDEMEVLATRLGDLGATPRDVIDVHTATLEDIRRNINRPVIYSYAADSRLFALEMMGMLVEYYRTGCRRLFTGGSPP